jgi:hypothetical protein
MITIRINDEERDLSGADEQWINQQINRRRAAGETVCVRITIHEDNINVVLATPTCGGGGGGGRPPNPREGAVLDLWDKRGLNEASFTGGNVVAFLKQLLGLI